MLGRINIFALKADRLSVLNEVESKRSVKYTLDQTSAKPKVQEWYKAVDLPDLGHANCEQSAGCNKFFLSDWKTEIQHQRYQLLTGETRYSLDQLRNPDTVLFCPAGIWKPEIIIAGSVTTISDTAYAQSLMRLFTRTIRKHFTKVKVFWVGPEAMIGFRRAYRLTIAEQSPTEYDLCD
jgi:hypothetical protein